MPKAKHTAADVPRARKAAASASLHDFLEEQVSAAVRRLSGVGRRKMLVSFGWTVRDRVFALVSRQSRIVVRLADAEARRELLALGGEPWQFGKRAAPRDWLQLPEAMHDDSEALALWLRRAWELGHDTTSSSTAGHKRTSAGAAAAPGSKQPRSGAATRRPGKRQGR